ncbi:MAG: hypothetical protein K5866_06005 [Treponema sp.]|nr:hypothetical protein [Treponema sp.]
MDNDNKIVPKKLSKNENARHKEVLLFLNDELKTLKDDNGIQSYNLEEEYSKTKTNHNWFPLIVLVISCLGVLAIALTMNKIIQVQNQKIAVNVSSFDDLNLKGLLDSVAKAQQNYDTALRDKLQLESEMEAAIKSIDAERDNAIFLLDSLKLSPKEYESRRGEIIKDHSLKLKEIHDEYDKEIILAQKKAETYKKDLDQFDSVKVQSAKEQEKAINSERQLYEMERMDLTNHYESRISELEKEIDEMRSKNNKNMRAYISELTKKYEAEIAALDPVLKDSKANEILTSTNLPLQKVEDNEKTKGENLSDLMGDNHFDANAFIDSNGITDERVLSALKEYQNFYNDYSYLDSSLLDLPHKNSIPEYVTASRVLVNEMGNALAKSAKNMSQENQELHQNIDDLTAQVNTQKSLLEEEKSRRLAEIEKHKEDLKVIQNNFEYIVTTALETAKTKAVILSVDSADNLIIKVYVAQPVRDNVTVEGIDAEIKVGRSSVKGLLKRTEDDDFIFEPGLDRSGKSYQIDPALIVIGSAVKTHL